MNLFAILSSLIMMSSLHSDAPLTILKDEQTLSIVDRNDYLLPSPGTPFVDINKLIYYIEVIDKQVKEEPINAKLNDAGVIIPEVNGYQLDKVQFKTQLLDYMYEDRVHSIEVPLQPVYPKVDSELLSNIRMNRIGQYITYYNSTNVSRSHNIALAVNAINNTVLFPGETFSFNQTVGERTKDKGYRKAPIIVKGEFSEGIGGGICQVSSTLYNAADRSGVRILERYSHSRSVPYVPSGRDATVSWGGPDFRFKNEYNQPILINAKVISGKVIIFIYSSEAINVKQRTIPSVFDS